MRVHRFYTGPDLKLKSDFWLHDEALLWQWNKVLRFRPDQEVVLFDGVQTDRLYRVVELSKTEAHLVMETELERVLPKKHIYLFWSLLKKDNNDHILQKCTELGVSNFAPLISDRAIRKDFNIDRARKIVLEASEQCGRSNIPIVREPLHLEKALEEYQGKMPIFVGQKGEGAVSKTPDKCGILIGPEGGWSSDELERFDEMILPHLSVSDFVLRAETAAITTTATLLQ
jgi:16S rRNA (uracil1498-N3)-methyltransferase